MRCVDCTICSLYRVDPPDDEQQACSKHVEAYYWSKLIENSAYCLFILYGYITMQVKKTLNFLESYFFNIYCHTNQRIS